MHMTSYQARILILTVIPNLMLGTVMIADAVPYESSLAALSPGIPADKVDVSQVQHLRNRSSVDLTVDKPLVNTPAKAHKPKVGIPALYFSDKTRILQQTRATTPDIDIAALNKLIAKPGLFIGPVQESRKSGMPENQTAGKAMRPKYSVFDSPSVLGNRSPVAMSLFSQRRGIEFLRMDEASHEILHGGN